MLFPEHIAGEDAEESYGFIVDYQREPNDILETKDYYVDLLEHRDSSVATLYVILGYDNFTGGNVFFRADDPGEFGQNSKGTGDIVTTPGVAMLHKGQHRHTPIPITSGRRVGMVIWLMGRGEYLRSVSYLPNEQLRGSDRWRRSMFYLSHDLG